MKTVFGAAVVAWGVAVFVAFLLARTSTFGGDTPVEWATTIAAIANIVLCSAVIVTGLAARCDGRSRASMGRRKRLVGTVIGVAFLLSAFALWVFRGKVEHQVVLLVVNACSHACGLWSLIPQVVRVQGRELVHV